MMKQLRSRKTMRRILQVTLILTIPSFIVFYGWGGGGGKRNQNMNSTIFASIKSPSGFGRTDLTTQDWVDAKNQLINEVANQVNQAGQKFNTNQIENAIPRKRIAEAAVNMYALDNVANERGFQVTDGELSRMVSQSFPGYSIDKIRAIVENRLRMSLRQWLAELRRSQKLSKAQLYITSAAHVTLPDLWRQYEVRETKAGLRYIEVPISQRKSKMTVSDAEVQKEYEARKEALQIPDKAIYEYISVTREDLRKGIQVTDQEVKDYYEKNKATQFTTRGSATIRHVLIQVPSGATDEQVKSAEQKIDFIHQKALSGVPLAQLANTYSQDPANTRPVSKGSTETVQMGGLLPTPITAAQKAYWGDAFIKTVFTIPEDKVSTPILTPRGWDIFQIVARTKPKVEPFDQVKAIAQDNVKAQKLKARMDKELEAFKTARKNQTTLEGMARALHTSVGLTSAVLLGVEEIPPVGLVRDYLPDIADLQPGGEPTGVIETGLGYAVLQMKELIPKHIPTLGEVRSTLVDEIKARKAYNAAVEEAKTIVQRVGSGDNLTSVALDLKLQHGQTAEPFAMGKPPFPYSQMQDLASWVLRTPVGKTFVTEGLKFGDAPPQELVVCQVEQKVAPDRKKFLDDMQRLELENLYENQQVLLNGYLADARRQLEPKYNKDVISSD